MNQDEYGSSGTLIDQASDVAPPEPHAAERPSLKAVVLAHTIICGMIFFVILTLAMLVGLVAKGSVGFWAAANRWPWILGVCALAMVFASTRAAMRSRGSK
jgi:hypothetical protein